MGTQPPTIGQLGEQLLIFIWFGIYYLCRLCQVAIETLFGHRQIETNVKNVRNGHLQFFCTGI
jgi:hypothetical protein